MACLQLLVVVDEPLHGGVQLGQLATHVVVACDQSLHLRASLLLFQLGKLVTIPAWQVNYDSDQVQECGIVPSSRCGPTALSRQRTAQIELP